MSGYEVQQSTNGGAYTDIVANTNSTATTYTACGLLSGSSYSFQVAAINSIGTGPYPNANSAPKQPTIGTVVPATTSNNGGAVYLPNELSVPFTLSNTGNSTITGFQYSLDGGTT